MCVFLITCERPLKYVDEWWEKCGRIVVGVGIVLWSHKHCLYHNHISLKTLNTVLLIGLQPVLIVLVYRWLCSCDISAWLVQQSNLLSDDTFGLQPVLIVLVYSWLCSCAMSAWLVQQSNLLSDDTFGPSGNELIQIWFLLSTKPKQGHLLNLRCCNLFESERITYRSNLIAMLIELFLSVSNVTQFVYFWMIYSMN